MPGAIPDGLGEAEMYARKADRIAIQHIDGRKVALIEIVSPGSKASIVEMRAFKEQISGMIERGVHLLVIDLLPATAPDPVGICDVIWDRVRDVDLPIDKPLTLTAYEAGADRTAYFEPVAVGDVLPEMPLFLQPGCYVPVPLETTYQATWSHFPAPLKGLLEDKPLNSPEEQ